MVKELAPLEPANRVQPHIESPLKLITELPIQLLLDVPAALIIRYSERECKNIAGCYQQKNRLCFIREHCRAMPSGHDCSVAQPPHTCSFETCVFNAGQCPAHVTTGLAFVLPSTMFTSVPLFDDVRQSVFPAPRQGQSIRGVISMSCHSQVKNMAGRGQRR